jgi:uridine kinase
MRKKILDIVGKVDYPYTCVIVDNQRMGFLDEIETPSSVTELLSVENGEGRRTYERTLAFLTSYCAGKINPTLRVSIKHSYGDTLYGEIEGNHNGDIVRRVKEELKKLVEKNEKIVKYELTNEEAMKRLEAEERTDDLRLLKYIAKDTIPLYSINGHSVYFAGPLLPRTDMIKVFDIVPYPPGFLLLLPDRKDTKKICPIKESKKIFETFQESKKWVETLGTRYAGDLNEKIIKRQVSELIKVQEALHEKKISNIADMIKDDKKLILIAGPSSSGKTTFAKRLEIQLKVNGLKPIILSTDNYFVDRDKTPKNEEGELNYDSFDAINHKLLQEQLVALLNGEKVAIPKYNFIKGKSEPWKKIKIDKTNIIILEGIHALNPRLTQLINDKEKFRIYVSALTQLNIDSINRIPTRDTRLIRRIVRDSLFRRIPASETLRRWPVVTKGEENYIFPFQENADVMFNSAVVYELAVLKHYGEVALRAIDYKQEEYAEALRLLNFLSHFVSIMADEIPPTSIMREFIGKSSFKY